MISSSVAVPCLAGLYVLVMLATLRGARGFKSIAVTASRGGRKGDAANYCQGKRENFSIILETQKKWSSNVT